MQSDNRLLDDLAKLATGAAGAFTSARAEAESALRAWLDRRLEELDLVTREEFEAAKEMAARAREENAALAERIEALEAKLAAEGSAGGKSRSRTGSAAKRGGKGAGKGAGKGGSKAG